MIVFPNCLIQGFLPAHFIIIKYFAESSYYSETNCSDGLGLIPMLSRRLRMSLYNTMVAVNLFLHTSARYSIRLQLSSGIALTAERDPFLHTEIITRESTGSICWSVGTGETCRNKSSEGFSTDNHQGLMKGPGCSMTMVWCNITLASMKEAVVQKNYFIQQHCRCKPDSSSSKIKKALPLCIDLKQKYQV